MGGPILDLTQIALPDIQNGEIYVTGSGLDSPLTAISKVNENLLAFGGLISSIDAGENIDQIIDGGDV